MEELKYELLFNNLSVHLFKLNSITLIWGLQFHFQNQIDYIYIYTHNAKKSYVAFSPLLRATLFT